MYTTEQLADAPLPARVQVWVLAPGEILVKKTNPVGVKGVPTSVSLTVAVHWVASLTAKGFGEQAIVVDVERATIVKGANPTSPASSKAAKTSTPEATLGTMKVAEKEPVMDVVVAASIRAPLP